MIRGHVIREVTRGWSPRPAGFLLVGVVAARDSQTISESEDGLGTGGRPRESLPSAI